MKTTDTIFGKRRLFCGCYTRLIPERLTFIREHLEDITFPTELCEKCNFYPFAFRKPKDAVKFKALFNKQHRTKEGGLQIEDNDQSITFFSQRKGITRHRSIHD